MHAGRDSAPSTELASVTRDDDDTGTIPAPPGAISHEAEEGGGGEETATVTSDNDPPLHNPNDVRYLSAFSFLFGFVLVYPETFMQYLLVSLFDPSEMQLVWCALYSPWMAKVLFAVMVDHLPSETLNYIHVCLPLTVVVWVAMGLADDARVTLGLFLLVSSCTSIVDVATDAIMVRRCRDDPSSKLVQASVMLWASMGRVTGAFGGGWSYEHGGRGEVFGVCAFVTLLAWAASYLLTNVRGSHRGGFEKFSVHDLGWLRNRDFLRVVLFGAALNAIPDVSGMFTYFLISVLQFPPTMMGTLDMVGSIAVVVGAWVYNRLAAAGHASAAITRGALLLFCADTLVLPMGLVLGWNQRLGIPAPAWAVAATVFGAMSRRLLSMPVAGAFLPLCPKGHEATAYAVFANACNLASLASTLLGSGIAKGVGVSKENMDPLWVMYVLRAACHLAVLPFVGAVVR